MSKKNIVLMVVATLMLSSCGVYKKFEPVSDTRQEARVNEERHFGDMQWSDVFTDPQLQALIEKALQNNVDLKKSHLAVQQMEASLKASKLAYLPSAGFNPSATFAGVKSTSTDEYMIPVALDWQIDIFGRATTAKRKANALTEEYRDLEQATRAELIAAVAKAYYSLSMIDSQMKIVTNTVAIREQALETQKALMTAGHVNSAAVSQFNAELCAARVQLVNLQKQFNEVRNSLAILIDENIDEIQCGSMDVAFPEIGNVEVSSINLLSRPDVRASQRALEAAFYAERGTIAEYWPNIGISASAGFNPNDFVWSVVGSLFQPIFQRGQLNANRKIAAAQQEQARLDFEKTLLTASVDIDNALCSLKTANDAAALYEEQEAHYQDAFDATNELMRHGQGSYLEVLFAQQALLEASLTKVANDYDAICSMITLYLALGGGK
ncbi:MAG: TolC family protein [Bacteroidales bacterium]|nr:TolC family protein [Bacteroidales bacterium]